MDENNNNQTNMNNPPEQPAQPTNAQQTPAANAQNGSTPNVQPAGSGRPFTDGVYSYGAQGNPYSVNRNYQANGYSYSYNGGSYTPNTYQQPVSTPKKKKNKNGWIALVIVAAILVGVAGGAGIYRLADGLRGNTAISKPDASQSSQSEPSQETPEETKSTEGISGRVTKNTDENYMAPSQIYNRYVDAVVGIANEGTTTNYFGQVSATASSGTGFIISEDGYILTNYHVVQGANSLTVTLNDGTEYKATIVGYENATCDVALLKIDATGLTPVSIGDSDSLQVGEEVCTIGNPLGELTNTLTVGYISAKDREINTDGTPINMMQTDAAINSGNSGGPLFDINGNVVGITTAKYSGSTNSGTTIEGLGFAIPINDVMDIVDDLQQYGYIKGRAYLGIKAGDSSNVKDQNLPAGAYVSSITDGYCAQKAGMQAGDVIVGMDNTVISSYDDLAAALKTYKAGEMAEVTVYRSGKYVTLTITLDERPADTEETTETTQATEPIEGYDGGNPFGFMFP